MEEQIVLIFDICSSTTMLEDLHRTNQIDKYITLINDINNYLEEDLPIFKYRIYKFLGDGFLLIFNGNSVADVVLIFVIRLVDRCMQLISSFIDRYIEIKNIPRLGITIGLDKGKLNEFSLGNTRVEFVGRAINVAVRLQSTLIKVEHINKCLMTKKKYNEVSKDEFRIICNRTTRSLKNVADEEEIICYEFSPLFYKQADVTKLRESRKQDVAQFISDDKKKENLKSIYATATGAIENRHLEEYVNVQLDSDTDLFRPKSL